MTTLPPEASAAASRVRALVLDVDGVLTSGALQYGPEGEEQKTFHVRDGLGIRLLIEQGIEVAVLTARDSQALRRRMNDLGVGRLYAGRRDKLTAFSELLSDLGIGPESFAYIGDDLLDVPVLRAVGLPIAVADAHWSAKQSARWVTELGGGNGAVREVADGLLEAQGKLQAACAPWLDAPSG